jgi:23S rRNA (uracil1939-C5)-methyltransferase
VKTDILHFEIESLAAGGDGVGRVDGAVCFVPFTAPGDIVRARTTRRARDFLRAELVEIERPGPSRRDPACQLFGRCGGCTWLHVDEETQLRAKASFLARAVKRERCEVRPSPLSLGYRRVARLHFEPGRGGASSLGFVSIEGRGVVAVEKCPVVDEAIERAFAAVRGELLAPLVSPVEVRLVASRSGVAAAVVSGKPLPAGFYRIAESLVPDTLFSVTAEIEGVVSSIAGPGLVAIEGGDGGTLVVPSSSFGQANAEMNRALGEAVAAFAKELRPRRGLELYAGAGNLSVALATHLESFATAELDAGAAAAARGNLAARGLDRVTVHAGDALALYEKFGGKADLVALDPPRTGCAELSRRIARGKHAAVIYVSCDPATLGRDIGILERGGFAVREALGFDMFPQTAHVEAAVLLTRP